MIALTDVQSRYVAATVRTRLGELTAEIRRAPRFSDFKASLRAEAESLRGLLVDASWVPMEASETLGRVLALRMTRLRVQVRRCANATFKDELRYEIALAGSILDRLGQGGTRTLAMAGC